MKQNLSKTPCYFFILIFLFSSLTSWSQEKTNYSMIGNWMEIDIVGFHDECGALSTAELKKTINNLNIDSLMSDSLFLAEDRTYILLNSDQSFTITDEPVTAVSDLERNKNDRWHIENDQIIFRGEVSAIQDDLELAFPFFFISADYLVMCEQEHENGPFHGVVYYRTGK